MSLSDKITMTCKDNKGEVCTWKKEKDVKEAVKELRNKLLYRFCVINKLKEANEMIEEIFGKELCSEEQEK